MRTYTNHIHTSFQVLLIATKLCNVFLSFTGFFNDLLTSKLFGLGMACLLVFAIATGFFSVATVFNMNVLQGNSAGDVSLDSILVMAQAQGDESSNEPSNRRCVIWDGECWPTLSEDPDWPACAGC